MVTIIVLVIVVVLGAWVMGIYNSLVRNRNLVDESWSGIDVQLKRRYDLIPNVVEAVKGYAAHEKTVFENVTQARASAISAGNIKEKVQAENTLTQAIRSLFAVAENYPTLRASENFLQLQRELEDTEDKVAYSRQFYNTAVAEFNTKLQLFPNVLLVKTFGFTPAEFFEAGEEERKKVEVKFG